MRISPSKQSVRFVVDDKPSGHLYTRRHDRRVTPYPAQLQALIDHNLLSVVDLEHQIDMRQNALDEAREAKPHVLCQIWQGLVRAFRRV